MRPLELTLEGFESYCNKTVINFDELGEKGLYIITGETGAGKTTLFDAITYALYGSASGDDRTVEMLRSTIADENTKTEVSLIFAVGDKKYKVTRNPEYERKTLRGNGTTKAPANATLYYITEEDKPPVTSTSRVNEAIQDILHLKREDFTQIAMIAQGKFEKFLLSETKDKTAIFRNIFSTEKYQKIQTKLKDEASELESKCRQLFLSIEQQLSSISYDEVSEDGKISETTKNLEVLKGTKIINEESLGFLKEIIEKDENLNKVLKDEYEEKNAVEADLNQKLGKANEKKNLENNLLQNKQSLKELKSQNTELKTNLDDAKSHESEKKEMEKQKAVLDSKMSEYSHITSEETEIHNNEKKAAELSGEISAAEVHINVLDSEINSMKKKLEELEHAGEQKAGYEAEQERNQSETKELTKVSESLIKLKSDKDNLSTLKSDASEAVARWQKKNNELTDKKNLFYCQQAGILAETLEENKPCPVCGSIHHPSPAKKSEGAPSQKELTELEKSVKKLDDIAHDSTQNVNLAEQNIKNLEEQVKETILKYFDEYDSEKAHEQVEQKIASLKNRYEELTTRISEEIQNLDKKNKLNKDIPAKEKEKSDAETKMNQKNNELSALNASIEGAKKNLEGIKAKLEFKSEQEAKSHLAKLGRSISDIEKAVENAENSFNSSNKQIAALNGQIESQENSLKQYENLDADELQKQVDELRTAMKKITDKRDIINSRTGKNRDNIEKIEKESGELAVAEKQHQAVNALYKTACGQIQGKEKIDLETYIQMNYLDQILIRANQRFKTMTDNVYELVRTATDNAGLRSKTGLDLSIIDHHSGARRSVSTLSGGEKFQASLALALGLSDEIQEASSGIFLESMFIDEGFATLDSERLNKVIKALNALSNNNKLIGMISHVGELEAAIPKHIVVTKNDNGISSAVVEID